MAWLAVDKDDSEIICYYKLHRMNNYWGSIGSIITLPKGSIKKLIGRDLKWEDDPVELK